MLAPSQAESAYDVFRENVRARCKEMGITQKAVADAIGITPPSVHAMLSGRAEPSLKSVLIIAELLHCTVDELLKPGLADKAREIIASSEHEHDDLLAAFRERARTVAHERGLTQRKLADECGVHYSLISLIMSGKRDVTPDNARKIAEALGIEFDFNG